ncbi:MAG: antitoxin ParD1/3/4 [Candidatus Endobugula sp.]|jgi:antitoxin ParD1/3/4
MAKNTSISLGSHFDDFIKGQVTGGRYGSASEVIRAGLRKLEDDERKLETLRALIEEGKASGTVEYSYDSLMQELDDELGK